MTKKFYVIETLYIGTNCEYGGADRNWFDISTEPARGFSSNEVQLQGWCGVNRDYSVSAHGEFDTFEQAQDFVKGKLEGKLIEGKFRNDEVIRRENISARYKVEKYVPYSAEDTYSWSYEALSRISTDTTDDQIMQLINEIEFAANSRVGATLHLPTLAEMFTKRREVLKNLEEDESLGLG
nr:hypothetical protein [uncultured Pseudomonas sp.]